MTFEQNLVHDWAQYCQETVGRLLPLNHIQCSDEGRVLIGFMVADGDPPINVDDTFVRIIGITYESDELGAATRH